MNCRLYIITDLYHYGHPHNIISHLITQIKPGIQIILNKITITSSLANIYQLLRKMVILDGI